MSRKLTLALAAFLCSLSLLAQEYTGGVKGTVVNRADREPVAGATLTLYQGAVVVATAQADEAGNFLIENLQDGLYDLVLEAPEFLQTRVNVTVVDGYVKNMFKLSMSQAKMSSQEDADDLAEFDPDGGGYNDNPTVLFGQNDVFSNIAGYNFSSVRFRVRGLANESQEVYLAGVKMNDALTGYGPFSLWSGLNEATRTKMSTSGAESSDYAVGGVNGVTNIPGTASYVRKGLRGSVLTNSALYRLRLMLSYGSGPLDNGWSYAFNVSTRLGGNDWIRGVYYRSFAYYGSVEKKFDDTHKLSAIFMAAPGQRGAQMAATQEVYDLMGDNLYNPNWGYQNGRVRNARVRKTHEPIAVLKYDYTPTERFSASATLLYRFGKNGYTALDWNDAADPKPDYYRNLPSYFQFDNEDLQRYSEIKAAWVDDSWRVMRDPSITQINWDRLYNVNRNNRDAYGKARSKYIQEERRVDQRDLNFAASLKWRPKDWFTMNAGFNARINRTENYKIVADLLGGDYYLNTNNFAERDFASLEARYQYDLDYYFANGKAQVLSVGDKYGYDYLAQIRNYGLWANGRFAVGRFSATLAGKLGYTRFWRDGLMRNGLFAGTWPSGGEIIDPASGTNLTSYDAKTGEPISSYGKSRKVNFLTYALKANAEYLIGGHSRIYANVAYLTDAPSFNKSFISPRTRNTLMNGLTTSKTFSTDLNYQLSTGGFNVRATLYYTTINDQSDVMSVYDDLQNAFTNFALTNIDQRNMGVELGFKVPTGLSGLSLQGVLAWGEYIYTSTPRLTQTVDNSSNIVLEDEIVPYWKSHPVYMTNEEGRYWLDEQGNYIFDHHQKHYIPGTPQLAASLGLAWNHNYWFLELNGDYFANSYLAMNPLFRMDVVSAGADGVVTPDEVDYMAAQEKFAPCFLLNASVGKSWYIQRKYQLGFSLNMKNLLNNKNVKTGGFEQNRIVDNTQDEVRFYKFDPKYFYMSGFNYMLNIYFRF